MRLVPFRLLAVLGIAIAMLAVTPAVAQEEPGIISGVVFHDLDGDGVPDEGEPGLPDWTIRLSQGDSVLRSVTSGPDGAYVIDGLFPGEYAVTAEVHVYFLCIDPIATFDPLAVGGGCWPWFRPGYPTTADSVFLTMESGATVEIDFAARPADFVFLIGRAILEDNYALPETVVEAFVNGQECGTTSVPSGSTFPRFELSILGAGERAGCAVSGDRVEFRVGGMLATEGLSWLSDTPRSEEQSLSAMERHAWYWFERIGDDPPAVGTLVHALVDGVVCGEATIETNPEGPFPFFPENIVGFSRLIVPSETIQPGCGRPGAAVSFLVDGVEAGIAVPWEPGVYRIDLSLPGVIESGDVNCDGDVNSIDGALVLQSDAGLIDALPCPENADVNGDGAINSIDAALILQYDAGLIGSLPP